MKTRKVTKLHGEEWDDRRDAKDTLSIKLRPTDFDAVTRNTAQCVLARAVTRIGRRSINGRHVARVWIGANVADVVFKDEPRIVYRYFLSPEDVKKVATFDKHPELVKEIGTWAKDITITLTPPPKAKRLGAPRASGKTRGSGNGPRTAPLRHLFAEVS